NSDHTPQRRSRGALDLCSRLTAVILGQPRVPRGSSVAEESHVPEGALTGPIRVVGTGLLGTSLALACRNRGLDVLLTDTSREHVRTASGLGAGRRDDGTPPQLVVVAVPPDHLGAAIAAALLETDAVVTDVGSIKSRPLAEVRDAVPADALVRYV